jgi:predicted DNA-binding transcriptional regulator AlpA
MTEISKTEQQIRILTSAVIELAKINGTRLDRGALAQRLGVHVTTITRWKERDANFPRPDKTGKWRLCDIIKWEDDQVAMPSAMSASAPGSRR